MSERVTGTTINVLAELIGRSPGIEAIREKVKRLLHHQINSRRFPPMLIQGETGTGKGLLAHLLHLSGPRACGPFIDVRRQHYSLYPATDHVVAAFKDDLAPYEVDKGTIRFPLSEPVPVKLIERIAKFRAKEVAERAKAKAATPKKR